MSGAKKCDICGALYEARNLKGEITIINASAIFANSMEDLCVDCAQALKAFVEPKEAESQPPKQVKTYKEDFLSKHPNTTLNVSGVPVSCVRLIYGLTTVCSQEMECIGCWSQPMPEGEE